MKRYLVFCLLAILGAGLYPAGGVSAARGDWYRTYESPTGRYCAVKAVPIDPVTHKPLSKQAPERCYTRLAALDASVEASGERTLVDFYQHQNYGGSWRKLLGTSCSGGINLRAVDFDNTTTSVWNSCGRVTLYFDIYAGPQESFGNGGTWNVGAGMNDQASSAIVNW
jgi:hypothetical protein